MQDPVYSNQASPHLADHDCHLLRQFRLGAQRQYDQYRDSGAYGSFSHGAQHHAVDPDGLHARHGNLRSDNGLFRGTVQL